MPRNGSGTYAPTAGNPVVTDTTISSTWANALVNDLANEVTASLDRNGRGGMLAPLRLVNGNGAVPALAFTSDPTTGVYRISAGVVGVAASGALVAQIDEDGVKNAAGEPYATSAAVTSALAVIAADVTALETDKLDASAVSVFGLDLINDIDASAARSTLGAAASGPVTNSGLALSTARVLGRTTAGTGAVEEISIGANLTLAAGVLSAVDGVPPGAIIVFARNTAPTGWLKANGALVSRTTYATLFAAIGTTFGVGDGSTTFGLPDLRGEFIRGWDDGRGVDSGRAFGSFQAGEIQSHAHTPSGGGTFVVAGVGALNRDIPVGGAVSFNTPTTGSTGGAETRPRNVALLACIKF